MELVEIPHIEMIYSRTNVRKMTPVARKVGSMIPKESRERISLMAQRAQQTLYVWYATVKARLVAPKTAEQPTTVRCPATLQPDAPLMVRFNTVDTHSSYDWIGVVPAGAGNLPGDCDGHWVYVPRGVAQGAAVFPKEVLPDEEGDYDVRYFRDNEFDVLATCKLSISKSAGPVAKEFFLPKSPMSSRSRSVVDAAVTAAEAKEE
jgi:hypothetical protein